MSIYTVEEFRIGNIVKQGRITEIFLSDVYRIKVGGSNVEHTTVDIDYEPLTEEWMIKLGAQPRYEGRCFVIWMSVIDYSMEFRYYTNSDKTSDKYRGKCFLTCNGDEYIIREIHHIHQLQNAYFVLTGNELTTSN